MNKKRLKGNWWTLITVGEHSNWKYRAIANFIFTFFCVLNAILMLKMNIMFIGILWIFFAIYRAWLFCEDIYTIMKMLNLAIQVAIKGRNSKNHHHGAIVERADGSFCWSANGKAQFKSPSVHAEARALRKSGLGAKVLYIARVMADGSWGLSKPCKNCQHLIKQYKVKKVIYTVNKNTYAVWLP